MTNPAVPKRHNGVAIRTIRTIRGISRDDLAKQAGVSYPYFANIENEFKEAKPELLHRVALILDIPVAAILRSPLLADSDQVAS